MSALPDLTNAKSNSSTGGQTVYQINSCTCDPADNYLIIVDGNRTGAGVVLPTSVDYNGVGLSLYGSVNDGVNSSVSLWWMASPTTGSALICHSNYATGTANAQAMAFIPYSGVNLSNALGTLATAFSAANNNPAVTATGAGAYDSYLSIAFNNDTAQTGGGVGNQVVTATQRANINGLCTADFNHILGTNSGAFTWTGSGTPHGTNWAALAVAVLSPPVAPVAWIHI